MKQTMKIIILASIIVGIFLPAIIFAATKTPFYYSGWIPFWKDQAGAHDLSIHLGLIREISPFSYEVNSKGAVIDKIQINQGFWPGWLSAVRGTKVKIIPTIAWFNGANIHKILSNKTTRIAQENAITKLVKSQNFDGIDIDYEAKLADTNKYFSLFIEGLAIRLHPLKKILSCTIEARMPISSRYTQTGTDEDSLYANDYSVLNKYCDEIRIMAYDQGLIDIKLDTSKGNGQLYAPVADPNWVEKVVKEATKIISPKKIMLGIPTYGYEYQVTWNNGITTYYRLRSHTFLQAMERANLNGVTPQRNSAGELSFVYSTSTFVSDLSSSLIWSVSSTKPAAIISTGTSTPTTRYVSFTDAESINQKITLAKKLGLHGVVFFKWDGEQDPLMWQLIK